MSNHIAERDDFLARRIEQMEVPNPRPDFWDTLTARLDDEAHRSAPIWGEGTERMRNTMSVMLESNASNGVEPGRRHADHKTDSGLNWPRPDVDLDALSVEYAGGTPGDLAASCPSTRPILG
ncbi:MAG: hypothetical protein OES24_13835 [Acidimicrobiia bacterium]|nr:hypothetical protein [Acidimicrobiia bacterium]